MALHPCSECQKEVSDKALACPHCGLPQPAARVPIAARRRTFALIGGVLLLVLLAGGGSELALRAPDYSRVEQLRAEQDADGTHDQNVRQRFFRLYKAHPHNAMYIYLWARCVDDAGEQLKLAEEGIRGEPRFSWNYNMAARALGRLGRVAEAYDQAVKGAAIDPGNMQLADKQAALKTILDHKLADEPRPATGADKATAHYEGLFRSLVRSPDRSDLQAIAARVPDFKGPLGDAIRGFAVCANPFADSCIRVYVPRDARFNSWSPAAVDVTGLKEHQLLSVSGPVVVNSKGETLVLADAVTVEAR
jgi:hypothetical protein